MKVFISWSGERSNKVAEALREWLPDVIQSVEPFLSSHDIPKGTRWGLEVARELEGTSVGIICLTPENLESKWVLFEAGALSKVVDQARICTYLFALKPEQLLSPLADFQATLAEKADTERLVASINDALGSERLPSNKLKKAFDRWWEILEEKLKAVPATHEPPKTPTQEEMLREIFRFIRSSTQPDRVPFRFVQSARERMSMLMQMRDELSKTIFNVQRDIMESDRVANDATEKGTKDAATKIKQRFEAISAEHRARMDDITRQIEELSKSFPEEFRGLSGM